MRFGRMYKGVVVSVAEPPDGRTLEECVGIAQADEHIEIPDDVGVGHYQQINGSWLTPAQYAAKKERTHHVQVPQ